MTEKQKYAIKLAINTMNKLLADITTQFMAIARQV